MAAPAPAASSSAGASPQSATAAFGAGTFSSDARPEPVATQLATVLAPMAHQPDGSYQVNIRLQPEDLGLVHVEVRLDGATVNVSLHADGDATRDMLRQNLGQLRQQLADSGLSTGRFDVGSGPASGRDNASAEQYQGHRGADQTGYSGPAITDDPGAETTPGPSSPTTGLLDMRL